MYTVHGTVYGIINFLSFVTAARSPLDTSSLIPHLGRPAVSQQSSKVAGGDDITGISNGVATAQGGKSEFFNTHITDQFNMAEKYEIFM